METRQKCTCGAELPPNTMDPHAVGWMWMQIWCARAFDKLDKAYAYAVAEAAKVGDVSAAREFTVVRNSIRWHLGWTDADDDREREERAEQLALQHIHDAQAAVAAAHMGTNGYLHRAGFPDMQALVADDGALVLPLRHLGTGELRAVQLVRWVAETRDWSMTYPYGMPALSVLRIGANRPHTTVLCVDYVAGLSIKAALEQMRMQATVVVCFTEVNLDRVAGILDKAVRGPEDANATHQARGLLPLCRVLMDTIRGT